MPQTRLTRRRTSSPKASRSAAVAVPVLIRKLQCSSETCAPPRRRPRQPAASISSQARAPGGLAKVEPPVRLRTGWVAPRCAVISAMRAWISAGSPARACRRAFSTTQSAGRPELR